MEIETFLSIASFAISVGGLISLLIAKSQKRVVVFAIVFATLAATSSVALYRLYQHDRLISQVENEIIAKLSHHTWTFDQIYEEMHYVPFKIVNESLFEAVEKRMIGHRVIEFRNKDGAFLQVKGYYVEDQR